MLQKTFLVIMIILINAFSGTAQDFDTDVPDGWAIFPGNGLETTTGGAGGNVVTATTGSQLASYAGISDALIIKVEGTITGSGKLTIASNKTILGQGADATITGYELSMSGVQNIIIRNLKINGSRDGIAARRTHHLWIDHCEVWDCSDGLIDITDESNYCAVSWCKFYYVDQNDHRLACLIGSGGGDHPEDWDKLKVTYHHNWYGDKADQRMPRIMYGQVHVFNDYYTCSGNSYCIGVGSYGSALIENNYFKNVNDPHQFMYEVYCWITARDNVYDNTTGNKDNGKGGIRDVSVPGWSFPVEAFDNPPYLYTMDHADSIPNLVSNGAGPHSQYGEIGLMPVPGNGTVDVSIEPTLQWKKGTIRDSTTSYIVSFGTTNPPPQVATISEQSYNPGSLEQDTVYYWRVDQDTTGGIIPGKVWTFQTVSPTSIDKMDHAIPSEFNLYPACPNPFNPETKITYSVSHPTRISLSVFDVNGRLIKILFNQQVKEGEHSFIWNASDLTSGVYFIKLSSDKFSKISKCTLLK